jgi:hypothetical protein
MTIDSDWRWRIAIFSVIGATWLGLGWVLWQLFQPPYLSYPDLPFAPTKQVFQPGEAASFTVRACNRDTVPHSYPVVRELHSVDGLLQYSFGSTTVVWPPGCKTIISVVNRVPVETPDGEYYIVGYSEDAQRLNSVTIPWQTEPFTVRR